MGETPQQMKIARWAGASAVGSPRWPNHRLVVGGSGKSSVVLQSTGGSYFEFLCPGGGSPFTPIVQAFVPSGPWDGRSDDSRVATFGGIEIPNAVLWARADAATRLTLCRQDTGAHVDLTVSTAGALTGASGDPFSIDAEDQTIVGPDITGISRVLIKSAPGSPSGIVLQDSNGVPWVIWVDAAGALRITSWDLFIEGLLVATGATAGMPGAFTPAGSAAPADLAALSGITASPATAWATDEYVALKDGSHAFWTGAAWQAGEAP